MSFMAMRDKTNVMPSLIKRSSANNPYQGPTMRLVHSHSTMAIPNPDSIDPNR